MSSTSNRTVVTWLGKYGWWLVIGLLCLYLVLFFQTQSNNIMSTAMKFPTVLTCEVLLEVLRFLLAWQHTYGWYSHHSSTTAPIAVGGHNTDLVYHIVGYSDWNTCSTGENCTETWTDSDGVVNWSPTIILWGLPLHCEGHTVLIILLNSGEGSLGRRGRAYSEKYETEKLRVSWRGL